MIFDQREFEIRCEWGAEGLALLAPISDVVVIVDVLSFSTAVDIATTRGADVYPYRFYDAGAKMFADSIGAILAGAKRSAAQYTLSPQSLETIPHDAWLVLPSPNGASLTLATGDTPTLAGCLRNARRGTDAARAFGKHIAIIPAGEQWSDGTMRPALEDWLGAGAILDELAVIFRRKRGRLERPFAKLSMICPPRCTLAVRAKSCWRRDLRAMSSSPPHGTRAPRRPVFAGAWYEG